MNSKLTVLWTNEAKKQLENIYQILCIKSRVKAMQAIKRILSIEMQLGLFPQSGATQDAVSNNFDYKFIITGDYKIIYHVNEKSVFVDTVLPVRCDPEFEGW